MPNIFHIGTRLRLIRAEHIPAISVEKGRDPVVRDAMNMHPDLSQLLHRGAEPAEVLVSRVLKIDRDVDVRHAETADTCRLVRQSLLMGVKPEVDDVAHAQCVDVS